jgi:hypothetical protein
LWLKVAHEIAILIVGQTQTNDDLRICLPSTGTSSTNDMENSPSIKKGSFEVIVCRNNVYQASFQVWKNK